MAKYDIEKDLTQAVPDTAEQERQALARQVLQLTREKEQLAGQLDEALRKNKEYRADLDAYIALVNQKEGYLLSLEKERERHRRLLGVRCYDGLWKVYRKVKQRLNRAG